MMDVLSLIAGLFLLFTGGIGLIRGSVTIAEKLKLSALLISTVIIGFGTSVPELLVSLDAALQGYPQIAIGNVVGSNISNVLLILGLSVCVAEIPCQGHEVRRDAITGFAAATFLALLAMSGYIHRFTGLAMIVSLIAYLFFTIRIERKGSAQAKKEEKKLEKEIKKEMVEKELSLKKAILITVISLIAISLGAHFFVDGAIKIAAYLGISKEVIALTVVAVGSSLPELVTALISAWRQDTDLVIGNILGSNLFNILAILGVTALLKPFPIEGQIAHQDVWIMLSTAALLMLLILSGDKIRRWAGFLLVVLYGLYICWLVDIF